MYQAVPQVEVGELVVDRHALVLTEGLLAVAAPRSESRARQSDGRGFAGPPQGDWVSIYWSWAREALSTHQRANPEYFTYHHRALADRTI